MDRITFHPEYGGVTTLFLLLAFHRALARHRLDHLGDNKECEQDQHHLKMALLGLTLPSVEPP
jgi:hypothetical protein